MTLIERVFPLVNCLWMSVDIHTECWSPLHVFALVEYWCPFHGLSDWWSVIPF